MYCIINYLCTIALTGLLSAASKLHCSAAGTYDNQTLLTLSRVQYFDSTSVSTTRLLNRFGGTFSLNVDMQRASNLPLIVRAKTREARQTVRLQCRPARPLSPPCIRQQHRLLPETSLVADFGSTEAGPMQQTVYFPSTLATSLYGRSICSIGQGGGGG